MAPKKSNVITSVLDAVIGPNDEEVTVSQWLDTGFPPLNYASSSKWDGGFPVGRMIEIAGPPSAGKTAIATKAMVAAQQADGIAAFNDHERSFSHSLGAGIGLNTKERFIYKTPKTFEESVGIMHLAAHTIRAKNLIPAKAPICWVFDSLAAMVPASVLYDDKGNLRDPKTRNMHDNTALARATSSHFPALAMASEEYDVCCIFLNQIRTKIGTVFGDPRKTTGGDSPAFYFSQRLWLSASQIKSGKDTSGVKVTGKFVKNKTNRPFTEADWHFMFEPDGSGRFDREMGMVEFLFEQKILEAGTTKGSVLWEGKQYPRSVLAKAIRETGTFDKLVALLPKAYEPPVIEDYAVGDVELEEEETQAAA